MPTKPEEIEIMSREIGRAYNCRAVHVPGKGVRQERKHGDIQYATMVETFEIVGHPTARIAYAWKRAQPKREVKTAVDCFLHEGKILSPSDAFDHWYNLHCVL